MHEVFSCGSGESLRSFKIQSDLVKFPFFIGYSDGYMLGEFVSNEDDFLYSVKIIKDNRYLNINSNN